MLEFCMFYSFAISLFLSILSPLVFGNGSTVDISTIEIGDRTNILGAGGSTDYTSDAGNCYTITSTAVSAPPQFVPLKIANEETINSGANKPADVNIALCNPEFVWAFLGYGCVTSANTGVPAGSAGDDCTSFGGPPALGQAGACTTNQSCTGVGVPNAECYERFVCANMPECGSDAGGSFPAGAPPSGANLCSHGTESSVVSISGGTQWSWTCSYSGVSSVSCTATQTAATAGVWVASINGCQPDPAPSVISNLGLSAAGSACTLGTVGQSGSNTSCSSARICDGLGTHEGVAQSDCYQMYACVSGGGSPGTWVLTSSEDVCSGTGLGPELAAAGACAPINGSSCNTGTDSDGYCKLLSDAACSCPTNISCTFGVYTCTP